MGKKKEKKQAVKEKENTVLNKLSAALAEYRNTLKEKKLRNNLRKVSRTLAEDIVKAERKREKTQVANMKVRENKQSLVASRDHQQTPV
ncbi:MAG TPA: hypothetical protein VEB63_11070 [Chitinophagaceae bacterium]|nr:hypothetical protein [Chitinophagaceae bacterium]